MNSLIYFIIGLLPLLFFSIKDLKYSKVENQYIIAYLFLAVGVVLWTGNYLTQGILLLFWTIYGGMMWHFDCLGGADYKILIINSIFINLITPNLIAGQFMFIMLLGINGLMYGMFSKLIQRKKEIPFIPVITLTYILTYLLWTV